MMLSTQKQEFQSTPPVRGATRSRCGRAARRDISIHAPREGGDKALGGANPSAVKISIHAPREGGDVDELLKKEDDK